jgi:NAD(P)-dependent dehydrogenase (short-subunit alcohol dehydrogenase family)
MGRHGKAAIVTGAGQGIGRGISLVLAREGARVAVVDINHRYRCVNGEGSRRAAGAPLQSAATLRSERKLTLLYPPPPRHLER